jgi:CDP-2,3-bis-(O-geranylgeranyl)-sn-glycerol synthase
MLLALWFFVPAGVANVTPIIAARLPLLKHFDQPIDGGRSWRGVRLLGDHKTWRGLLSGTAMAVVTLWLQTVLVAHNGWLADITAPVGYNALPVIVLGILFGLGALGGDALESFFKRQIRIKPGHGWFPFDQIDYIVGGAVASLLVVRLEPLVYLWVLVIWLVIHLFMSWLGWCWKLKDRPI